MPRRRVRGLLRLCELKQLVAEHQADAQPLEGRRLIRDWVHDHLAVVEHLAHALDVPNSRWEAGGLLQPQRRDRWIERLLSTRRPDLGP